MKCYVINLDRAPDRLNRMKKILTEKNISFERFAAVDGKTFTSAEMSVFRAQSTVDFLLVAGDIACGASHLEVLKKISAGNEPYAAVMEDDVHLSNDICDYLNESNWIPAGCDIIKLETVFFKTSVSTKKISVGNNRHISKLISKHGGTGLYIISRESAEFIVKNFKPGMQTIDHYMFGDILSTKNIYQMIPAVAIQDQLGNINSAPFLASSIHQDRIYYPDVVASNATRYEKPKGFKKIIRELKRVLCKIREVKNFTCYAIHFLWDLFFKKQYIRRIKFRL